jgi:hypothetical protein
LTKINKFEKIIVSTAFPYNKADTKRRQGCSSRTRLEFRMCKETDCSGGYKNRITE